MRPMVPRSPWALGALVALAALALVQLGAGDTKNSKKKHDGAPPKVQETVGDLAYVVSKGEMKVEGVGLVVGLDNTGADPPPSWYRKQLVDEMSKAGVEKAEKVLASPQVSMVLVHLTIPVGIDPKDPLDVQVEVPRACATKSLAGGYLISTRLREVMIAPGRGPQESFALASARGPVMLGTPAKPDDPKFGRVLGGGRAKKAYPYTLVIKENRESIRASKMLETVINERFHQFEDGHQKGVANAKSPSYLELKVPTLYHQNQDHFFRVVQHLQMIDSPELRPRRVAAWAKELADPTTAGAAALKLEGLGSAAIDALKEGLKSSNAQVRFFSAESLAYLDDTAGVDTLGETVIQQPGFRAYALAALAAMDQPAAHLKLRKLMDQSDIEIRYGAFNALRTLDPHDPFLGLVQVLDRPKVEEEEDDSPDAMAVAIVNASRRRRSQPDDPFALYVVDSEGPPLVHVSRSRRSEIVIFGQQQKLLPPVVLGAGPVLLNAAESDEKIEVSKIVASRFGDPDIKTTASLDLAEVIRKTANLGATYPEIVLILEAALRQKNLPGNLVVDAVPAANRIYTEAVLGKDTTAKRDSSVKQTSGTANKPTRRWFFGILGRSSDNQDNNPPATAGRKATVSNPDKSPGPAIGGGNPSSGDAAATPDAATKADSGTPASPAPSAKRDDSIQKATGEDSTSHRRSFFDLFRRSDEP
jgi:flagellar basal body P-ring protein FlgI